MPRPTKRPDLLAAVHTALKDSSYILTEHARQRLKERSIALPELLHALETGHHERAKDEFVEHFQAWNYSIRGKTLEGRQLRVAVAFDPNLMVITVIDLDA